MSGWQYLDFILLASQTEVLSTMLPRIPLHLCTTFSTPPIHPSLGGSRACVFMRVQKEHWEFSSSHLLLRLWFASLFSFLFPSSLGINSDVECLGTSTWIYCLHCFLCMTLYAVSMLKQKKKEEITLSKTNLHVLDKKRNRGCILSVRLGIMLLPLCAFGLCVAVFCQHEILSPLEDFRGGRATSPKIWRNL